MASNTINDMQTVAGNAEGTLLAGRYRIARQLGQGGMGSVWLAEDMQLDGKPFAIKMLPSILVANKRAYRQLKDEALVAMRLVHPNIVQIRAFEENNGNPFLVMDYLDGQTLDDYLADKGKLSEDDILRVLRPIAAALDYAHAKGVVHRDVKPGNVMIAKDGTPYILDFGIAREIQETLTRVTGKFSSGTLLYMSPEQLNGAQPKPPQDVYSFAAMAYECLKGEPPFARGQIEYQILNNPPDPLPGGPRSCAAAVMAGLAKKPEDRPATCADVLRVPEPSVVPKVEPLPPRQQEAEAVGHGTSKVTSAQRFIPRNDWRYLPPDMRPSEKGLILTPSEPKPKPIPSEDWRYLPPEMRSSLGGNGQGGQKRDVAPNVSLSEGSRLSRPTDPQPGRAGAPRPRQGCAWKILIAVVVIGLAVGVGWLYMSERTTYPIGGTDGLSVSGPKITTNAVVYHPPVRTNVVVAFASNRFERAVRLSKQGKYAEALREYEAVRNAKGLPRDEMLFRLGDVYRVLARTNDAQNCFSELIDAMPTSRYVPVAMLNYAMLLTGAAREKKLKYLDREDVPDPIRATALNYLGDLMRDEKNTKEAINFYLRAAKISAVKEVSRLAKLKAAALLSESEVQEDRRQACSIYDELAEVDDPQLAAEALFSAAMLNYHVGSYKEAAARFHRLASKYPDSPRVRESHVFAAWSNYLIGSYQESLKIASPLRGPDNEDAYYITASSLRMLKRRGDAIHAYAAQLQAFPKGRYADDAWFDYLTVVAAQGDNAGVLAMLSEHGDPPAKYAERAWCLGCESAIALTNYPAAIEYVARVAKNRKSAYAPNAVHRLAWLLEKTQDWQRAAETYRDLANSWPTNQVAPQALFLAGSCETKCGRYDQACMDWKNLDARYPQSPYAGDALYARAIVVLRRQQKTVQDYREVERVLDEFLLRFPNTTRRMETLYWSGVAAHGADDAPKAEERLRAALNEKPSAEYEREIKLELAAVLKKRGAEREAAELFTSLLDTKAVDRLTPELLEWTARTMINAQKWDAAIAAASTLERRQIEPAWKQVAATLVGQAREGMGEKDAAMEAYARALATGSNTESGAQAALALGRLESANGLFNEARKHLNDAISRAQSPEMSPLRDQAQSALAEIDAAAEAEKFDEMTGKEPHTEQADENLDSKEGTRIFSGHKGVQLWKDGPYWAETNIGAEKPEDGGYCFLWGDTVGYKREGDRWMPIDDSKSGFSFDDNPPIHPSNCKENIDVLKSQGWITEKGWVIKDYTLTPEHDAAHVHWGGYWRMPTKQELDGLCFKCVWKRANVKGKTGYVICGKNDYASAAIFLPDGCCYWSSVPDSNIYNAWFLTFHSGHHYTRSYTGQYLCRHWHAIRPVHGCTK